MKNYTVTLTSAEDMALSYAALDQQDWIDNAIHERCRLAIDEIVRISLEKSIETDTPLPTSKDEIVILALEHGWIKSAADQQKEFKNNQTI
jgi:hypothetical protein